MIHNGIEYCLMQAYAEGFELLQSKREFNLDLYQIAEIWRTGSVVRSWLLDLTARALADNPDLEGIKGWVADSGEGRWTVFEAIDQDVPAPVITLALQMRFASRQEESFSAKLLAALRNQFGGHEVKKRSCGTGYSLKIYRILNLSSNKIYKVRNGETKGNIMIIMVELSLAAGLP
jgi:6-phosphogluconate dehydrogenase